MMRSAQGWTAADWTDADWTDADLAGGSGPLEDAPEDAPVPMHLIQAAASRAQRDRMLLVLLAFFAVAVAATIV